MSRSIEYSITEPDEIHDLVQEISNRSENQVFRAFLDHQEDKNAVRGRGEPFRYGNDLVETRREDGGLTWYHEPEKSKCFMMGVPNNGAKNNEEIIQTWGSVIEEELEELGYNPVQGGADIYDEEGRQLVGLSGRNKKDSTYVRACWYEEMPEIDEMLEADNIDPDEFYNAIEPVEGLYQNLKQICEPEEVGKEFLSTSFDRGDLYSEDREFQVKGSCVLGYE